MLIYDMRRAAHHPLPVSSHHPAVKVRCRIRARALHPSPSMVPLRTSLYRRVTLNSHEVLEHSQTKAPCYPARTDGLPTPNLSEETKGDSNRKSRIEEKCTLPPQPPSSLPSQPPSPSLVPAGPRWTRAASVPPPALGRRSSPASLKTSLDAASSVVCPFAMTPMYVQSLCFIFYDLIMGMG